jgi:hypothetical protein
MEEQEKHLHIFGPVDVDSICISRSPSVVLAACNVSHLTKLSPFDRGNGNATGVIIAVIAVPVLNQSVPACVFAANSVGRCSSLL